MRTIVHAAAAVLLGVAAYACPSAGYAQGLVRFVASYGSDAAPCTRTQPCRGLQKAVDSVPNGGEVQVLDSGAYGPVTITKSVTISAVGVTATVTHTDPDAGAITINSPTATVVLRGLHLIGFIDGGAGVFILDAKAVHITHCVVEGFAQNIFTFENSARVFVADTISRQSRDSSGLDGSGGEPGAFLSVSDSSFTDNFGDGIVLNGFPTATIVNSSAAGNGFYGIRIIDPGRLTVMSTVSADNQASGYDVDDGNLVLVNSTARGNLSGVGVHGSGVATLTNSTITNNLFGISNSETLFTTGSNTVAGNGTDLDGNPPIPLPFQ